MTTRTGHRSAPYLLLLPTLVILLMFTIYPLFYAIYLSLHNWNFGAPLSTMRFVGGQNFVKAFTDPFFWISMKNTAVYLVFAVGGEFLLGFAIAYFVTTRRSGSFAGFIQAIKPLVLLPMIVTPVVVALMWRQLYNVELGLINFALERIGIPGQSWLTDTRLVLGAVIVTDIWEWTPFMFLVCLSALMSLSEEPVESARVDGANALQVLVHIILPMISPLILVAVLIRSIDLIKIFDLVFIMTAGGPGNATEVISLFAYRQGFMKSDIGYGSAVSLMLTVLVTLAGLFAVRKLYRETEA